MSGNRNPLAGKLAWVSSGRLLAAIIQAITFVVLARLVAPSDFGMLSAVLGIATAVQTASDMGVSTFVSRERAANPQSGSIPTALRLNALTSLLLAAAICLFLVGAGVLIDATYFFMVPLAIWASAERNADMRLTIVFADGDVWINVLNLLARRLLSLGIFVGLTSTGVNPILGYCLGTAFAALASSTFANVTVQKRVTGSPTMRFRELVGQTFPYWVHSLATQLRNLDVALIGAVSGPVQAGLYSTASRLTNPLLLLPSSLASLLLPTTSRAVADGRSIKPIMKALALAVGIMTLIYGLGIAVAPAVVPFILGDAYAGSALVMQIVLAGLPFAATSALLTSVMQGRGQKRVIARISTATAVLLLGLVSVGAAANGGVGGAAGFAVALLLQCLSLCVVFRRSTQPGQQNETD